MQRWYRSPAPPLPPPPDLELDRYPLPHPLDLEQDRYPLQPAHLYQPALYLTTPRPRPLLTDKLKTLPSLTLRVWAEISCILLY